MALAGAPLVVLPAQADPEGTGVVLGEAYVNGGSEGAAYVARFVELYNPTDVDLPLEGLSLQYRSATGTEAATGVFPLSGTVPAGGTFLIAGDGHGTAGDALPTPNLTAEGFDASGNPSGGGTILLVDGTDPVDPGEGSITDLPEVVDLLGYGTSNTYETSAEADGYSVTASLSRTEGADTDDNAADFAAGAPSPTNAAGETAAPAEPTAPAAPAEPTEPAEPAEPSASTIAEIQGTGTESPLVGQTVTTRGVVTATYGTGGLDGYYIQTPGTGGTVDLKTHTASDGVFVDSPATVGAAVVGSYVEVTGEVAEAFGATHLVVAEGGLTPVAETVTAPLPVAGAFPVDPAQRESLEGMLLLPTSPFTVTDNFSTNRFGTVGLAQGTAPLVQPTVVTEPGSAEYEALVEANAAIAVTLDDGADIEYTEPEGADVPLPYLSADAPVRVGAAVTFTRPVVLDFAFGDWTFQPTAQLTGANAADVQPAAFADTRPAAPATLSGDVTMASFNVLNYFTTTGDELEGCEYFADRAGDPVTVSGGCDARGAAEDEDLQRQQAKIVSAINALGADVVSLEEIENSAALGQDRDEALSALVDALNAAAGEDRWAFVPSPADVPENEDVIRTAFIYDPRVVETVGDSVIFDDPAFANARQPLAQAFELVGGTEENRFLAIVNHFKSKSDGGAGADDDQGDGQGEFNAARVAQAEALVGFADDLRTETEIERVLLSGDFNSYLMEDPIDVIREAGYTNVGARTGKQTYAFGGAVGSLDHIFVSDEAAGTIAGSDVWNINAYESVALEYSRYNYNVSDLYEPDAYRSSDHDPILVGLDLTGERIDVNLLNINDFHGRIDQNTVNFAATVESLRQAGGEDETLFLSAGDNIGASLFASASQQDEPTIDVLNALELRTSAVGNHEFDQGFADLTGRVADSADWNYLGANVYEKGTQTPALQEYELFEVDGLTVAVIGAVTQETPTLVSPAGIADLDFGDPVEAVNRVAAELTESGTADVIIAEYHEGAAVGITGGSSLEEQLTDADSAFTSIVTETSAEVDAIFTGHTHQQYAWDAPVPGEPGQTRPILQTGSYGEFIGQIVLSFDTGSDDIGAYAQANVPRIPAPADAAAAEQQRAAFLAAFPRVAEVSTIVEAALAEAEVIGSQPVGEITVDITRAYSAPGQENRGAESTLGNLVADSLVASLSDPNLGGAEIGVVNPGGLRADLGFAPSGEEGPGVVTFAEANAVLPFVNNLWTTTLTGAQFKTVLEQQWQRDAAGNVPSRPFLALGLSDNVEYTWDDTRPEGDRITGIWVDGQPIDPARGYRIGSFNFLLQGGDNFREFANGTDTRDSGLVDRDAWISYITANSPLSPSFDRRGVRVTDVPTGTLAAGASGTVSVSNLDLTSLGSPVNTEISAAFEGSAAAPVVSPVTAGAATAAFTVPSDVSGNAVLVLTARESGTEVRIALTVEGAGPGTPGDPGTPGGGNGNGGNGGSGNGGNGGNGGGNGNGNGGGNGGGNGNGGGLAYTGSDAAPAALAGGLLLLLGAIAMVVRGRRRLTDEA
ncbi:ExeM/NucH family extracellular endonuclease [Microbacteriaceae bacterium 4G12]